MTQYESTRNRPTGFGRTGSITCSFAQLVALFGKPATTGSNIETTVEWNATNRYDGDTIHVWDYKLDIPAEQNTEWSVNASSPGALDRLKSVLQDVEVVDEDIQDPTFFEIMTANLQWMKFSASDVNVYQGIECDNPRIAYLREFTLILDDQMGGQVIQVFGNTPETEDSAGQPIVEFKVSEHHR